MDLTTFGFPWCFLSYDFMICYWWYIQIYPSKPFYQHLSVLGLAAFYSWSTCSLSLELLFVCFFLPFCVCMRRCDKEHSCKYQLLKIWFQPLFWVPSGWICIKGIEMFHYGLGVGPNITMITTIIYSDIVLKIVIVSQIICTHELNWIMNRIANRRIF